MSNYSFSLSNPQELTIGGYQLNTQLHIIQLDEYQIRLRNKLWSVLVYLLENQGKLVDRQTLIDNFWNGNNLTGEQGVTHTVCHLRQLFKKYGIAVQIMTVPKKGYVLDDQTKKRNKDTLVARLTTHEKLEYQLDIPQYENSLPENFSHLFNVQNRK